MGPICSEPNARGGQLGNAPRLLRGGAVGTGRAPWHREGGNPEVNSSRRDVRTELTVGARRGRQVSQQGQVPATPRLAARQSPSTGPAARSS